MPATTLSMIGALCFGVVIGWVTYRTLRRQTNAVQLSDVSAVLAATGGAAVTTLPFDDPDVFGMYAIGLAAGFFGYLITEWIAGDRAPDWMGD